MSKKNKPTAVTAQRPGPQWTPPRGDTPPPRVRVMPGTQPFRFTLLTPLKALASLRLTVVLLLMSMVLVYAGTLAQVDQGVWQVVDQYFWSSFVWIPAKNLIPHFIFPAAANFPTWVGIPFLGGKLLGLMLFVNLIAAHATRFKLTWKRLGIWLIHAGMILLLVGEAVTRIRAEEFRMSIEEGKSRDYLEDYRDVELAFVDLSDPKKDHVAAIPASRLKPGRRIDDAGLPVEVEVVSFYPNSVLKDEPPAGVTNPATKGVGLTLYAEDKSVVSGVSSEQTIDLPSAYVRLIDRASSQPIGVFLVSTMLEREEALRVDLNGKPYLVTLRFRREYLPYRLHLNKFTHDKFEGTETPKDYRSYVTLIEEDGSERDVEIYMNAPLRYAGKTFYQADFFRPETHGPGVRGTILQVVENPGWIIPYISCALVSLGMLIHFGRNLTLFAIRKLQAQGVPS